MSLSTQIAISVHSWKKLQCLKEFKHFRFKWRK